MKYEFSLILTADVTDEEADKLYAFIESSRLEE